MKKRSRIILIAACSVAVGLLGVLFIRNLIDFPVYYTAGRSLLSGRIDLYAPDFALGQVMDYRYPPFFLVALIPLWLAPYSLASYLWYLLSALEIAGCVLIVARAFPGLDQSKRVWILIALATAPYFVMMLHYGNAHLLASFFMFAALYFFLRRKDVTGGFLMALAITIKITPVLILPYFVIKRRWKMLVAVCAFLGALNLVPAVYFGLRTNNELLASWYRHVIASQEFHEDNGPINMSLKGQLRRYFSTVDYSLRVDGDVRYPAINLASSSRGRLDGIWLVAAVSLYVIVLFVVWLGPRMFQGDEVLQHLGRDERSAHELSLMICLMLLVGPLTSKIYFIALLWPLAGLASFAADRTSREGRAGMLALLIVAFSNLILTLLPGRSIQRLLLVLGVDFYLNCLVMASLMFVLLSQGRAPREQSGEPQRQVLSQAKTS